MTKEMVLENLKGLIGAKFDTDKVICAFEDFEENDETNIIVEESSNVGYRMIAFIDTANSTEFCFSIDKENTIQDVWMR